MRANNDPLQTAFERTLDRNGRPSPASANVEIKRFIWKYEQAPGKGTRIIENMYDVLHGCLRCLRKRPPHVGGVCTRSP